MKVRVALLWVLNLPIRYIVWSAEEVARDMVRIAMVFGYRPRPPK